MYCKDKPPESRYVREMNFLTPLSNWQALYRQLIICLLLAFGSFIVISQKADGEPFLLDLPINCVPGVDCWLVNLVDHDPTKGKLDFRCSDQLYDGHKGTDIAIRDLGVMREGVFVLAAAPGEIAALRDGMLDQIPGPDFRRAKKNFCGNGVVIRHAAGWETQYCHLRRKSILVNKGEKVLRGQPVGLVGLSGMTIFPHIHLTVRYRGKVVDPFVGVRRTKACGIGDEPLWSEPVLRNLAQDMTAIYNFGFASKSPNVHSIRAGLYRDQAIFRKAPAFIVWAEIFWVQPNDKLSLRVVGPDGEVVVDHRRVITKRQARQMVFAGKKKRGLLWPEGQYRGEVVVERVESSGLVSRYAAKRDIKLSE